MQLQASHPTACESWQFASLRCPLLQTACPAVPCSVSAEQDLIDKADAPNTKALAMP